MQNKILGEYFPAFFCIVVDELIDFQDFESNPKELKATFIHEYCHYLQDVSTTYGFFNFVYYVQELLEKIEKDVSDDVLSVQQENRDVESYYRGDIKATGNIDFINEVIKEIDEFEEFPLEKMEHIIVRYNGKQRLYFGNYCVAESMAYLVERLLYDSKERVNEFPYNVCEKVCEVIYPEINMNKVWVLALCELSLLEVHSGKVFYAILYKMKELNFIPNKVADIETFVEKYFSIGFRGRKQDIEYLLSYIYPGNSTEFLNIKKWIVEKYEKACEFREIRKCFISSIFDEGNKEIKYNLWQIVMDEFGAPNIINGNGELLDGAYIEGQSIDLGYMMAPLVINQLLDKNGKILLKKSCPLLKVCQISKELKENDGIKCLDATQCMQQKGCLISSFLAMYEKTTNKDNQK